MIKQNHIIHASLQVEAHVACPDAHKANEHFAIGLVHLLQELGPVFARGAAVEEAHLAVFHT